MYSMFRSIAENSWQVDLSERGELWYRSYGAHRREHLSLYRSQLWCSQLTLCRAPFLIQYSAVILNFLSKSNSFVYFWTGSKSKIKILNMFFLIVTCGAS
jgi:hypothetical protein